MNETKSKANLVALISTVTVAIVGLLILASQHNPSGLMPGDVYSQGLDVERNEQTTGLTLLTVYGQDVITSPSLLRSAELGPREPRAYLAVIQPAGAFINGTGLRSEHGEDWSVLRETLSWGAMQAKNDLNNTVEQALTYEYDGRKQKLKIASQSFSTSDGNRFVVLLDNKWTPTVYRVGSDLNMVPVSDEQKDTLQGFFGPETSKKKS
ncbi:MAG: hypothetical protein GTO41_06655 [Burkholderiales bacterium]|nr:hypothetical protein [Burkholderiales bacterium]